MLTMCIYLWTNGQVELENESGIDVIVLFTQEKSIHIKTIGRVIIWEILGRKMLAS